MTEPDDNKKEADDPYKFSKAEDFMCGLLIFGVINIAITVLIIITWFNHNNTYGSGFMVSSIPSIVINIMGIIYFSKRRKYLMFGIFPVLLCSMASMFFAGSCMNN